MPTIVRIKRSAVSGNPANLALGELAYSSLVDNGSNGGDRLYIGTGTETNGNASEHTVIGGKYFTDMLDHAKGTLTASSAVITDANNKVDQFKVDNLTLDGNVISSTDDVVLSPTGNVYIGTAYRFPKTDGISGYVLTTNGGGILSFQPSSSSLNVSADSTNGNVNLLTSNLRLIGGEGIDTSVSGNTVTIAAELADYANKGVAEFNANSFTLSSGNVELRTVNSNTGSYGSATAVPVLSIDAKGRITSASTASISTNFTIAANVGSSQLFNNGNTLLIGGNSTQGTSTTVSSNTIIITVGDATTSQKGVASFNTDNFTVTSGAVRVKSATIGSTTVNVGSTVTTLAGLTQLDVDNIRLNDNTISSTNTNGDLVLDADGTGNVNVNNNYITNVATPINDNDAANKLYVDQRAAGLDPKQSVRVATTANIVFSGLQTIDGISVVANNRVLVKDQTTASQNGIYVAASGAWSRSTDFDDSNEVTAGTFVFVEEGNLYADSGWVVSTDGAITVGSSNINFVQFSGAGQIVAGAGLSKSGNTLEVNTGEGLTIVGDNVQLNSTVAGNGLTYSTGVINAVGTTNRISVSADAIDISNAYVGQSTITTLGTITTGTWNGITIAAAYGGTGFTSYAVGDILVAAGATALSKLTVGADGKVLQSNGTTVVYGDIDGGTY